MILVNIRAIWRPWVGREMPSFYRDWHSRGFEILALSVEDTSALVAAYIKKEGDTFPAGIASIETQRAGVTPGWKDWWHRCSRIDHRG